jgi:uncharacterized DUF497 family protein
VRISGFEWDEGNVLHLTLGHGIEAEGAEDVFPVSPFYRKAKRGHDTAFGPIRTGGLLVMVFEMKGRGLARTITGWDMDNAERRHYQEQRRR